MIFGVIASKEDETRFLIVVADNEDQAQFYVAEVIGGGYAIEFEAPAEIIYAQYRGIAELSSPNACP